MSIDIASQFSFPIEAQQDFAERGGLKVLSSNQNTIQYGVSEHDKGIPFEFFVHNQVNGVKSEIYDMEINDEVECIRWVVKPRKFEPVARVLDLPPQLLKFRRVPAGKDPEGNTVMKFYQHPETGEYEVVSGQYKDAYLRWKQGLKAPGLSLDKWGRLSNAQIKTLANQGVFSVEQFTELEENYITERFPPDIVAKHKEAKLYMNAQANVGSMSDIKKYADQVVEEKQRNSRLERELNELRAQFAEFAKSQEKAEKKPRGRPKKVKEPEIEGFELGEQSAD